MDIRGKCVAVLPLQTGVSAKGEWRKLDFVIEYGEEYPKKVCFQLFNKVEMAPAVGDNLTVFFSAESKEYNGKWFTNLNCWKVEGFTGNLRRATQVVNNPTQDNLKDIGSDDELPF